MNINLERVRLEAGSHDPGGGLCLMEWLAQLAGEDHTDTPQCIPVDLAERGQAINDCLDVDTRQALKRYGKPMLAINDGLPGDWRRDGRTARQAIIAAWDASCLALIADAAGYPVPEGLIGKEAIYGHLVPLTEALLAAGGTAYAFDVPGGGGYTMVKMQLRQLAKVTGGRAGIRAWVKEAAARSFLIGVMPNDVAETLYDKLSNSLVDHFGELVEHARTHP